MPTKVKVRRVIRRKKLGPCHEWLGAKYRSTTSAGGYGKRMYKGKVWLAHRAAWDETYGPIPNGMLVCHKCDNRICVRPSHLFLGTAYDNMQDMVSKGRCDNSGERNGRAKLTEKQVREIRRLYTGTKRNNPDFVSQKELARRYGVNQTVISRIVRNDGW